MKLTNDLTLNLLSLVTAVAVIFGVIWSTLFLINTFKTVYEPDPKVVASEQVTFSQADYEFIRDKKLRNK